MLSQDNIKGILKNSFSKEFFIFLFFLFVSASFWFMSTLNDTYEEEFPIRVEITNVPRDIVITQALPDTMRVTLKDKGFNLLRCYFSSALQPIDLHFADYTSANGRGIVNPADIQKVLRTRLAETTTITSVKADRWDFYYNHGASKKVPILVDGQLLPSRDYYVERVMMSPDSAVVYATQEGLDTIRAVYTIAQAITGIHASSTRKVQLQYIPGAKIVPDKVKMTILADQMTEVTLNVPVKPVNVPEGMSLKTFPARMDIIVAVGLKRSRSIKPEMFSVVADYNDITADPNAKLKAKVLAQPNGVIRTTLQTNVVDYVIEKF